MERILTGNILSFAKGIGVRLDKEVICKLTGLRNYGLVDCKGVKLMAFDGEFRCNVSLPDFIGIGKSTSVGFGMVTRI
jgi:CRISPR/Cas system endoribonuclease Cas6 (RAMP superfamily)